MIKRTLQLFAVLLISATTHAQLNLNLLGQLQFERLHVGETGQLRRIQRDPDLPQVDLSAVFQSHRHRLRGGFLRLDRNPIAGSATSLYKEARICDSLSKKTAVPVPQLYAWSDEHCAALLSRDGGRSDIDKLEDQQRQRAIMEDFIGIIARLHRLNVDQLGLDDETESLFLSENAKRVFGL